ncbi:MAG: discoidin domain-containing protein, partial [Phycisphaerales bacterium]
SRYNNDVFLNGVPQWVEGYFKGGLEFDGTDDYLDRGAYEPSLDIVGELTVTAWVKPGATIRDHEICGNITTGANGGGYTMGIYSNNNLELEARSSAGTSGQPNRPGGGTALQRDTWYFLAATYVQTADGGVITTYVNGVFDREEVTTIVMAPSSETFKIGRDASTPGLGQFIGALDDVRVYDHVVTEAELRDAMLGKWPPSEIAFAPRPEDEQADVPRDVVLGWTPGIHAQKHDVYFGSVFEDVHNASRDNPLGVLINQNQDANAYDPGLLDFSQAYFWRVDEVNAPPSATVYTGEVWTFTTEPFAYAIPGYRIAATASSSENADTGPGKTIDGSGLANDLHSIDTKTMWASKPGDPGPAWIQYDFDEPYKLHRMLVWNYNGPSLLTGFGIREAVVEYSTDGANWTALSQVNEFARAPGAKGYACNTIVDLDGIVAQAVRITANSNWGGAIFNQYGLSEVRFLYIPLRARYPSPGSGATDVAVDATLSWRAGREAAEHDVYLSTDEKAVTDGSVPADTVAGTSYGPLSLDLGQTYYWKVNEVNIVETPIMLEGDLWSFSTREYLVVDGFEDYNDYPPYEIYSTWLDGYENPANGSQVGYLTPPAVETTIVHGGDQSMPLLYSNTGGAAYSEAERTFAAGQDWTEHGIQTLVLYFHGTPGNTGQLYVKVNSAKVAYPGNASDIARPRWKQWNIDLASLGIDLTNVMALSIGIDGNGASGTLYVDDIRLYGLAPAQALEEIWIEAEAGSIAAPLQVFSAIPGASGGQYIEVAIGNNSADGPPATGGVAGYTISVQGGTYKINARVVAPSAEDDSFWVRIQGATTQTINHSSGWVRWNDIAGGSDWHWDVVHSSDDGNKDVEWTMGAGTYTLDVAYREDGALLDALMMTRVNE